ncbi:hypothetical protein Z945_1616 [Sulfitobacter noctilucae]|nr:hypothetical protein Z945_1616 [Sulfitobacter noctilucae]
MFDGVYVTIRDHADGGCWTNIRETRNYAQDQLELVGFNVIEMPERDNGLPHPVLRENIAEFKIQVDATRAETGLCHGSINTSFWAAVSPKYNQRKIIIGQIGLDLHTTIYNSDTLNEAMFDSIKTSIQSWMRIGVEKAPGE